LGKGTHRMRTLYFDIDDKTKELRDRLAKNKDYARQFNEKFELSWIYHENALDGLVLDVFDLKAALDHATLEDGVLIPTYQRIRNHKNAIEKIRKQAEASSRTPSISFIKGLHQTLAFGINDRQAGMYRKDIPIHRTYYHEISPPAKIAQQMTRLMSEMKTKEFRQYHPLRQAAELHYKMMNIFPFDDETGKVARLAANFFVLRSGYLPIIIPAIDRQHYYESLRIGSHLLHQLIVDCMERTVEMSIRQMQESTQETW
jgi:Fic family protein